MQRNVPLHSPGPGSGTPGRNLVTTFATRPVAGSRRRRVVGAADTPTRLPGGAGRSSLLITLDLRGPHGPGRNPREAHTG